MNKITVKHFLNTDLQPGENKELKYTVMSHKSDLLFYMPGPPSYPLYIKITYMRKTTQVRSFILNSFSSLDEAFNRYGELLQAEQRMIEYVVANEAKKDGIAFSLKGISDKNKIYNLHIANYIRDKIAEQFNQFIKKTGSPFRKLLTIDLQRDIKPETYFLAAKKILGENSIPDDIAAKFVMLGQLNTIRIQLPELFADYFKYSICCWKFGKGKQYLEEGALRHGFTVKQVRRFIQFIDDELKAVQ
jgi:hypothetical protein